MKIQSLVGLCLGMSLLLAGTAAMADKGKDNSKKAKAMQMQLDKKTGKKLSAADDSELATEVVAAEPIVDAKGMMPLVSEPPQYHADGSTSIKVGSEHLEYLVLTIDENGEKSMSHQKHDEVNLQAVEQDKGEK